MSPDDPRYDTEDFPLVDLVGVEANARHGHIALSLPDSQALAAFCDVGNTLQFWAYNGFHLDATGARNLASALVAWADRKASIERRTE